MHKSVLLLASVASLLIGGCATPQTDGGIDGERMGEATLPAGGTTHMLLALDNITGDTTVEVEDDAGLDITPPEDLHQEGDSVAGWITVHVPADTAEGSYDVSLRIGERDLLLEVHVGAAEDILAEGDTALVDLVLHTTDGALVFTNMADVVDSALEKSPAFEQSGQEGPLPLPLVHGGQLPPEMVAALIGTGIGHAGSADLVDFFDSDTIEQEIPRDETVERGLELDRRVEIPRQAAESQGAVAPDAEAGDPIVLGGPFPYVIEEKNSTTIVAVLDVEEDDAFTIHEPWPEATKVIEVTDTKARFHTDPPVQEGEDFTWRTGWDDASRIVAMDDETITIRHSPEEGATTEQPQQGGTTATTTVVSVHDDIIVLAQDNPHPHAGQTIILDFTVVDRQAAETSASGR